MKRILTLLAYVAIAISSYAYDFEEGGIYYKITSSWEKTVGVTYKNNDYKSYSGFVVIPASVTDKITSTTYSVTSIEDDAFYRCSDLVYVTIPNSVTSIGAHAFSGCTGLTSVTIPNSVTSIGGSAFYGCSGLTSVTIPNSVTSIGGSAFDSCTGLTSVTIPNSVTSIGGSAFSRCSSLTSVTIPNSVTSIGSSAFFFCSGLKSVTIPNSVTRIGIEAFNSCSSLTSVTIPNSVMSIGNRAFSNCSSLTSIIIPNSVTRIGDCPFSGCSGLTSITVENGNPNYDSRDNCNAIIETCTNTLISGCLNTVIPNYVTRIGIEAFYGCSGLTSIIIPNSVTSIGNSAFSRCSGLTSIIIPNSVTKLSGDQFYGCSGLTSVTIPNSVTGYLDAFRECAGLKEITIGRSVTELGYFAFQGCKALESINIRAKNTIECDWHPRYNNYGCPFDNFDATIHVLKGYKEVGYICHGSFKNIIDDLEPIYMEGLVIDVNNKHFEINESSLRANAIPTNDPDDNSVTWSTTTPDIMMVAPETGDFMGVRDGIGELVATANDGSGVIATAKVYFGNCYPQPDAIETVSSKNDIHTDETVYNLKGMRVDSHNLPAGIYIKNGKKVMVK